jgi:hypothetical protein
MKICHPLKTNFKILEKGNIVDPAAAELEVPERGKLQIRLMTAP